MTGGPTSGVQQDHGKNGQIPEKTGKSSLFSDIKVYVFPPNPQLLVWKIFVRKDVQKFLMPR